MNTDIENSDWMDLSSIQFADIINLEDLQRLQDLFADANGVASIITNPDGTPITQPSKFTRLCKDIIRKTEKGCANCYKSDAIIGRQNLSGPIVQTCLSGGLWDAGASISVGGKHIANWLIGQVRNEAIDIQTLLDYADEIKADKKDFQLALSEVPVMSVDQFHKVAKMLYAFANEISGNAYKNLKLKIEIAEREAISKQLSESKDKLAITLHSIGDGVITKDVDGLVVNLNPMAEKFCGWNLEDAYGKPLTEIFRIINSETREIVSNPVKKVLQTGQIMGLANHTVLISKDGKEYQIADSAAPIKNEAGEIQGVVLVFSDVTEKYLAEDRIRISEKQFYSLFENMKEGAAIHELVLDKNGVPMDYIIIKTNNSFEKLLGMSKDTVIGKTSREAYCVEKAPFLEIYSKVALSGEAVSFESYFAPLNKHFSISVYCTHSNGFATIFEDISERKTLEKTLQESERKYRLLTEFASDVIWVINLTTRRFTYISPSVVQLRGYTVEEAMTQSLEESLTPESLILVNQAISEYLELFLNEPDKMSSYINQIQQPCKDGKNVWVEVSTKFRFNEEGDIEIVGISRNIEERKRMMNEISQREVALQKLNAEKDKFFSIIAHDLKSPFNSIVGFSELLLEQVRANEFSGIEKYAEIILQSSDRAMNLLMNLMEWSRSQTGRMVFNPEYFELVNLIHETVHLFTDISDLKLITIRQILPQNAPVFADKAMISTVLRNLISNAIKFTMAGGDIQISIEEKNKEVLVAVKDNGLGLSKNSIQRLFRIDDTVSTPGTQNEVGTGLGLILCKEFIEKHQGKIWVDSEEGKGSTFYFSLPKKG